MKEVEDYKENAGWLIYYDCGTELGGKGFRRLESPGDMYGYAGATLVFLDKADAIECFSCEEFGEVCMALMLNDVLPEFKYLGEIIR